MVTRPFSSVIGMSPMGFKNRFFFYFLGQRWRKHGPKFQEREREREGERGRKREREEEGKGEREREGETVRQSEREGGRKEKKRKIRTSITGRVGRRLFFSKLLSTF